MYVRFLFMVFVYMFSSVWFVIIDVWRSSSNNAEILKLTKLLATLFTPDIGSSPSVCVMYIIQNALVSTTALPLLTHVCKYLSGILTAQEFIHCPVCRLFHYIINSGQSQQNWPASCLLIQRSHSYKIAM